MWATGQRQVSTVLNLTGADVIVNTFGANIYTTSLLRP